MFHARKNQSWTIIIYYFGSLLINYCQFTKICYILLNNVSIILMAYIQKSEKNQLIEEGT